MSRSLLRLLCLVFAHKSVAFLRHTISPPLVDRTGIKIGITKGYICLPLLKQIWVIPNPPAVRPYPCHFWFVGRAANRHTKRYGYKAG